MRLPKSIRQVVYFLRYKKGVPLDTAIVVAETEIAELPYVHEVEAGPFDQVLFYAVTVNLDDVSPYYRSALTGNVDAVALGRVEDRLREILTKYGFTLEAP